MEASQRRLDIFARSNVVLDLVDERGVGDAPRVARRGILSTEKISSAYSDAQYPRGLDELTWKLPPSQYLPWSLLVSSPFSALRILELSKR